MVIDGSLRERTVSVLTAPIMPGAVTSTRILVPTRSAFPATARIETVPRANVGLATALLDGIAEGWPEERPPQLTPEQRTALAGAARNASGELSAAFARVAARWQMPGVFNLP